GAVAVAELSVTGCAGAPPRRDGHLVQPGQRRLCCARHLRGFRAVLRLAFGGVAMIGGLPFAQVVGVSGASERKRTEHADDERDSAEDHWGDTLSRTPGLVDGGRLVELFAAAEGVTAEVVLRLALLVVNLRDLELRAAVGRAVLVRGVRLDGLVL